MLAAGYIIEGGRGQTAGKVLRFGHLGATDEGALNAGLRRAAGRAAAMSRPVCVVAEPIAETGLELLRAACEVVEFEPGADLSAALADAEALVVRSATRVDAALIASAPKLRVIGRAGVGVDNVDVHAATAAGIVVCNAPEANVVSAAEHALALLLALARNISVAERSLREGCGSASASRASSSPTRRSRCSASGASAGSWPSGRARSACAPWPTTRT